MPGQLLVFFLLAASAAAQVTLDGDVVRKSTGEPLAGVRVTIWSDAVLVAVTDAAGHFQFTGLAGPFAGLPAASGRLFLDGPGLLARTQALTIRPQDTHITLRVAMTPQSAIAGKVVDENGWPVQAIVMALQYRTRNGARVLQPVRTVHTDDLGAYRIGKLPPGSYYLHVRPLDEVPWSDYLPVWYPTAPLPADARAIELTEGREFSGFDFHLAPGGGVQVRGSVIVPSGHRPEEVGVNLAWEGFGATSTGTSQRVAPDGSFTLRHVAPGTYRLTATILSATAPQYSTTRLLEVSSEPMDGITLNVGRIVTRDLKGTIVSKTPLQPDRVQIALQGWSGPNTRLTAQVERDGSFVIPGVQPGRYTANAWVEDGEVLSFRFGGQDLLGGVFDFDGTEAALLVTALTESEMTQISGTVRDAGDRPVAGAGVVAVPEGETYEVRRWESMPASTDQNGAFSIPRIPCGNYRIYVVEDPTEIISTMANPGFLQAQEKVLPPVTVSCGENPPLRLVLPSR